MTWRFGSASCVFHITQPCAVVAIVKCTCFPESFSLQDGYVSSTLWVSKDTIPRFLSAAWLTRTPDPNGLAGSRDVSLCFEPPGMLLNRGHDFRIVRVFMIHLTTEGIRSPNRTRLWLSPRAQFQLNIAEPGCKFAISIISPYEEPFHSFARPCFSHSLDGKIDSAISPPRTARTDKRVSLNYTSLVSRGTPMFLSQGGRNNILHGSPHSNPAAKFHNLPPQLQSDT